MKELDLRTEAQFLDYLRNPRPGIGKVYVKAPVVLPPWVTKLPDIPIRFYCSLDARFSHLTEFNALTSTARTNFTNLRTLKRVGPEAEVGEVDLTGTAIEEYSAASSGEVNLQNCPALKRFGMDVSLPFVKVDYQSALALATLTSHPKIISISQGTYIPEALKPLHASLMAFADAADKDIGKESRQRRFEFDNTYDVTALLSIIKFFTSSDKERLDNYRDQHLLLELLVELDRHGQRTSTGVSRFTQLIPVVEMELVKLSRLKIVTERDKRE